MSYTEAVHIKAPSAPTAGATVTLFDSYAAFGSGKQLYLFNAAMLFITFNALDQDSAANGLACYTPSSYSNGVPTYVANTMRDDTGSATMPQTIASADAPRTYRFQLAGFPDFKVTYTASASAPATWSVSIVLHTGGLAVMV